MTDLARLASEITQGRWEKSFDVDADTGHSILGVQVSATKELVVCWGQPYPDSHDHANATAMALLPALIAEVLQLREVAKMERERTEALLKDSARKSGIIRELEERLGETSV